MDAIFAFGFAAGLALAIPVGPMAILLIETTTTRGWRFGATGGFAMASVDFAYALAVFLLGSAVAGFLATWGQAMTLVGAAILIWIGFSTLTKNLKRLKHTQALAEPQRDPRATSGTSILKTFGIFAGATLVNPPTALYFLAIAPTVAHSASASFTSALIFGLGVFLGSVIWQQTLAAGGLLLRKSTGPRLQAITGVVGGLLILMLAVSVAIKGFH
ncbi:MAG: LysE family transporter [Actinomycetales bacterium]|nr:LysE family transporter [Actinomycetales bacterium]